MNLSNVSSISTAIKHLIEKLDRGTVTFSSRGEAFVKCKKHPDEWIDASYSQYHNEDTILDYLIEAFERCKGCLEEKRWAASRFPEGSEL